MNNRISLVWYMLNKNSAVDATNRVPCNNLDVISPTWFRFDKDKPDGSLVSCMDVSYIDWAHEQGYKVWPLIADNFDYGVSRAALINRAYVASQLLEQTEKYGFDGINVDYEMIRPEDIPMFHDFLAMLHKPLTDAGKTLSVDMYVPMPHNLYYGRRGIAEHCDYFIIMGYDEHWSTCPTAGPNASIGFAERGIFETLKEVPAEKTMLAVPFYVRAWEESGGAVKSVGHTMESAYADFTANGAEFVWDDEKGCYYGEYTKTVDGAERRSRVWLEDERSIEEKLKLVTRYGLAGVAAWRKGAEKLGIWDLIGRYK